jgi:hypothetical protein
LSIILDGSLVNPSVALYQERRRILLPDMCRSLHWTRPLDGFVFSDLEEAVQGDEIIVHTTLHIFYRCINEIRVCSMNTHVESFPYLVISNTSPSKLSCRCHSPSIVLYEQETILDECSPFLSRAQNLQATWGGAGPSIQYSKK